LWESLQIKDAGTQGNPSRILLAKHELRFNADSQNLRQVPVFRQRISTTTRGFELRFLTMAFLAIGGRPSRTFPSRKMGVQFAVVAVDYFTKWAEAEALSSITAKCIEKFL
jgi:hypothetical protein